MCMTAVQNSPYLLTIDHKFLLHGHTHMECDTDHSHIEKKKKKFQGPIEHPHDWAILIRQTGKKNPFLVTEMESEDFKSFSYLLKGPLQLRKINYSGEKLNCRELKWLHYEKTNPFTLFYKTSLDKSADFQETSFARWGTAGLTLRPPLSYHGPQPISIEKKRDLMTLLPLISGTFHDFYNNLHTKENYFGFTSRNW